MHCTNSPPPRLTARPADLEVWVRVRATGIVADAILSGRWYPTPALLEALGQLVNAAAMWARVAEAAA